MDDLWEMVQQQWHHILVVIFVRFLGCSQCTILLYRLHLVFIHLFICRSSQFFMLLQHIYVVRDFWFVFLSIVKFPQREPYNSSTPCVLLLKNIYILAWVGLFIITKCVLFFLSLFSLVKMFYNTRSITAVSPLLYFFPGTLCCQGWIHYIHPWSS